MDSTKFKIINSFNNLKNGERMVFTTNIDEIYLLKIMNSYSLTIGNKRAFLINNVNELFRFINNLVLYELPNGEVWTV